MKGWWIIVVLVLLAVAVALVFRYVLKKYGMIAPVNARITSPFGDRVHPVTGVVSFHNGIDFGVPAGTEIHSPAAGVVASVYSNATGGKQLIIDHDNGFTTGYAHLSEVRVSEGDRVAQGQVVALSGNTGVTTGAHLHFTMRDATHNYVDPVQHLA